VSASQLIAIVDCGLGNMGSIRNMLRKVGARVTISNTPEELSVAEKIVLPGVGSFDEGMARLEAAGFRDTLERMVMGDKVPILGICLGMQLFTRSSAEGTRKGFGWLPARTEPFRRECLPMGGRIPHMGWNTVTVRKDSVLFESDSGEQRFYFLHSYHVVCEDSDDVLTFTEYGYPFASAVLRGNILGAQFHPEKSHRFGMEFLRRFVEVF